MFFFGPSGLSLVQTSFPGSDTDYVFNCFYSVHAFNLIGKSTMVFLTDQSWRKAYSNPGKQLGLRTRISALLVRSVAQASHHPVASYILTRVAFFSVYDHKNKYALKIADPFVSMILVACVPCNRP